MKEIFIDYLGKEHVKPTNRTAEKRTSVYGLFEKNKKILMVKSLVHNLWELPGGGVDDGETELEALTREFLEETGYSLNKLNLNPLQIFDNNFHDPRMNKYYYNKMKFMLVTSAFKKENSTLDSNEVEKVDFIDINKLNPSNCQQYTLNVIKNLSKHF